MFRVGAFEAELRQRKAKNLFAPELYPIAFFEVDLIPSAIINGQLTGFLDADLFGTDRITVVNHETGFNDTPDAFGSPAGRVVTFTGTGFVDPDAFGSPVAKQQLHAAGFADPDAFGSLIARANAVLTGFNDTPDLHGALISVLQLHETGFLDPDAFGNGTMSFPNHFAETGFSDPDFFGTLHVRPNLQPIGYLDADAFGSARLTEILHAHGFIDPDKFGLLLSPQTSIRRKSRRRPFTGNIARARHLTNVGGNVGAVFDIVLINEPLDIQSRGNSFVPQLMGLVTKERIEVFADLDSRISIGDRIITSSGTYLVTQSAIRQKQLVLNVDLLVVNQ